MSAAHTSGPWAVVPGHRGFIITANGGAYDIAVVRDIGNKDNEANARLIAAAPCLLDALQEVIGIVQASIVNAKNRGEFPLIVADLERREANARAAIAKATGEGA